MTLREVFSRETSLLDVKAKTADDILHVLAEQASQNPVCEGKIDAETIFDSLQKRELQSSTGFGNGVAIPHARLPHIDNFLVFYVRTSRPLNFNALDGKKVQSFFVILAPEKEVDNHIKLLASLSRLIANPAFRREIEMCRDKEILYEIIIRYSDPAPKRPARSMRLFFIILFETDLIYEVLECLIEHDIEGATILESSGMGAYISNIPLFAGFLGFMREDRNQSKTIMALVPEEMEGDLSNSIEKITGNFETTQGAMIMSVPLSGYRGNMKMV